MSLLRVPSGSASMAVDDHGGEGPAVLCLHAGVADRRSWDAMAAALAGEARVVVPDRRNFGLTTYDPDEPFSEVDDAIAVLDGLDIDRALVVGNSMGGRLALSLALEHPRRVAGLVLIGTGVTGAPWPPDPPPDPELMALDEAYDAAEEAGDHDLAIKLGAHLWLDGCLAEEGRVGGELRDMYEDMNRVAYAHAFAAGAAEHPEQWSRLGEIKAPTAVVFGSLDLPYLRQWSEHIAATIPDATFHELEGLGHLPAMEEPDVVAAIVRDVANSSVTVAPATTRRRADLTS
jgi:pimeloyl-ACP methyl ester carboxylesterase